MKLKILGLIKRKSRDIIVNNIVKNNTIPHNLKLGKKEISICSQYIKFSSYITDFFKDLNYINVDYENPTFISFEFCKDGRYKLYKSGNTVNKQITASYISCNYPHKRYIVYFKNNKCIIKIK